MLDNDKPMNEQESLALISEMIGKAKASFHENGSSAILWGSVIGLAGLVSFAQKIGNFSIGFDIWLLVMAAIIPQVIISVKESRRRKVIGYDTHMLDAVWTVYWISLVALLFYINIVPGISDKFFIAGGKQLLVKNIDSGAIENFHLFIPSSASIYIILFAIPTLVTGMGRRFKPMLWGGVACYLFFVISCFTASKWDPLLMGLAGIFNWLIPGLILRKRYLKGLAC